jgi:hypothetical protein
VLAPDRGERLAQASRNVVALPIAERLVDEVDLNITGVGAGA